MEHVWPKWTRKHFPIVDGGRATHHLSVPARGDSGPWVERAHGLSGATGYPQDLQVRVVCRECNQGWMSKLESGSQRVLVPMMMIGPASRLTIDHADQQLLATWAVKTGMMFEQVDPPRAAYGEAQFHDLKNSAAPPRGTEVWIGRCDGTQQLRLCSKSGTRVSPLIAGTAAQPMAEDPRNLTSIVISIGGVLLYVRGATDGFPAPWPNGLSPTMTRIWPRCAPFSWPLPMIADAWVERLTHWPTEDDDASPAD